MTSMIVSELKKILSVVQTDHLNLIMKSTSLKYAHVYCVVNKLVGQKYGFLLERYIRERFGYTGNRTEECRGDCSKGDVNYEIKVSLGGRNFDRFNYVQIRPRHDCNMYILTAYHLTPHNVDDQGDLYIFRLSKDVLYELICKYGCYAHGSKSHHGIIKSPLNESVEYALRPTHGSKCWMEMLKYRITEDDL